VIGAGVLAGGRRHANIFCERGRFVDALAGILVRGASNASCATLCRECEDIRLRLE